MIASKKRTLLPGTAYGLLIPPSAGKTQVLRNGANTDHTIETVKSVVRSTLEQTTRLATELKGRDLRGTCSKIWHFVYRHIQYRNDDAGYEQVRHPARIWADRVKGVDCDDYTVFISSILLNLGIPHKLRVTDYGRGWQHIYVVVPKSGQLTSTLDQKQRDEYIVIDCVPNDFDYEVRYTRKMDIPMQLQVLSGLDGVHGPDYGIDGYDPNDPELGNIFKKFGNAIKSGVQAVAKAGNAVAKVAKKVVASPVRAGVLVFLKLNTRQSASRLRWGYFESYNQKVADAGYGPKAWEQIRASLKKLQKTYVDLGGRADALRGAILYSPGNKDKAVPVDSPDVAGLGYLAQIDPDWQVMMQVNNINSKVDPALFGIDGLGVLPAAAPALIAAATPIIIPILNMISKVKANDPSDPVPDEYLLEEEQSDEEAAAAVDVEPTQPDPAVEGLGALAKKKAKKVATVVAKKKPALVAKATARVVQKAGAKPTGKMLKTAVKPATKAAVKAGSKPKAIPVSMTKAGGSTLKAMVGAQIAKKNAGKKRKIIHPAVKPTADAYRLKTKGAGVVAPLIRPLVIPDSTLPALPVSLPTLTDQSGAKRVVMPTAPPLDAKTAKKQAVVEKKFKKQQAKRDKKAARKPAGNPSGSPVTPPVATQVDDSVDTSATTSASVETVAQVVSQTAQAAAQVVKDKKVADVLERTGKVSQTVAEAARQRAGGATKPAADDASMVDATAETEAQARAAVDSADVDTNVSIPDGTPAPKQAGFFSTADGKTDWVRVGIAGAGAYVLSQLLLGDESAASHPRPPRSKAKGLSGTGKKTSRKRSKSLAGLEAVPLS